MGIQLATNRHRCAQPCSFYSKVYNYLLTIELYQFSQLSSAIVTLQLAIRLHHCSYLNGRAGRSDFRADFCYIAIAYRHITIRSSLYAYNQTHLVFNDTSRFHPNTSNFHYNTSILGELGSGSYLQVMVDRRLHNQLPHIASCIQHLLFLRITYLSHTVKTHSTRCHELQLQLSQNNTIKGRGLYEFW